MSPTRHPSGQMIARYATGELAPAVALAVAAHLHACADCGLRVEAIEEAEGRLMASLPDAPLRPSTLDAALARLPHANAGGASPPERIGDITLPPAVAAAGFHPRRWMAPGFWAARSRAPRVDGWRMVLLRTPPGARLPLHSHRDAELVVVVTGAFDDEGAVCAAGDYAEYAVASTHAPKVTDEAPCACLIATKEPSHWHGLGGLAATWLGL